MVFENPLTGIHSLPRSGVIAREVAVLDWTAKEIGVRPLSEFVGTSYKAALEGLMTVQALIREISAWPSGVDVKDVAGILAVLRECERVLAVANEQGAKWRFELDREDDSPATSKG